MTANVFAYGTLCLSEVMELVAGEKVLGLPAELRNYSRYAIKERVFPGIVAEEHGLVDGVLYQGVSTEGLRRIGFFEDDFYERQEVCVELSDGTQCQASAYVIPDRLRHVLTQEPWDLRIFVESCGGEYLKRAEQWMASYLKS